MLGQSEHAILGASAAIFKQHEILLIQRSKGAYTGLWSLPGGHIKKTETAQSAALREIIEETNISAKLFGRVDTIDVITPTSSTNKTQKHYRLSVFYGIWLSGTAHAKTDAAAVKWAETLELDQIQLTPGALDIIIKAEQMLKQKKREMTRAHRF